MSSIAAVQDTTRRVPDGWPADAAAALFAALAALAVQAVQGFPTLMDAAGNNDNLMRLVEVRDLLSGQGWYDLHQYRMGLAGGFVMHWSRLVDAPIAGVILAVRALGGGAAFAETAAAVLWPSALMAAAVFLILRCVRRLGDAWSVFPGAVIGATTLYFTGLFAPGAFDHHNVQIVLTLAMLCFLLQPAGSWRAAAGAGACAALMLAVGMETLPYVAGGGAAVAVGFLVTGEHEKARAGGFGLAFAAVAFAALAATVPPGAWTGVRCDAFSGAQFAAAAVSGLGLAAIAFCVPGGRLAWRALALGGLAAALGVVALAAFPQCLDGPYAGLDPQVRRYWLSAVVEAQSIAGIMKGAPEMLAGYYATPLVALGVLALAFGPRRMRRRRWIVVAALLAVAVGVSLWQLRGAMFALPLAVIPLAVWVGDRRRRTAQHPVAVGTLKTVAMWLVSTTLVWQLASIGAARALPGSNGHGAPALAAPVADECYGADDYARLAALPAGTVLAASNIGAPILRFTRHETFAGPYHRDVPGLLFMLDVFMAPPDRAGKMARRQGVDYVAVCPGNPDSGMLAQWAPGGLMGALMEGRVPPWLVPVEVYPDHPLQIYRAVPAG